ncbi:uncharacterized protein LOC124194883 [Daphnia pulex]|uniref:uncharacterized protein LOC124194883 n=1 Tax=Daphnia pulex TaxID=6669 RepID=UPI001EDCD12C|nr:uncharacterized protein LOC124194883 [Daphnia pulex]
MSFPSLLQLVHFLLFISTFHSALGIQCYRCLPKAVPNTGNQTNSLEPCSKFDGSSPFVIDCPLSTFCMKRNFTLEFPDGRNAIVTERGCAQQSFSYRVLKRGQWQTVNDVNETIYQDGCILEHQGTKPPTQYCYCSSRLCNAATPVQLSSNLLVYLIIFPLVYYVLL